MAKTSDDRKDSELHWFPFYVKDFVSSPDVQRMDDTEVGRYLRLLLLAWGGGTKEPSLEADDLSTASARVIKQFHERDGRLYNRKLSKVWKAQKARHDSAVRRGKKGGRPKAQPKLTESSALAGSEAKAKEDAMVIRERLDTLSRGAGAVPDGGPAPPNSDARTEERGKGFARLADLLPAALRPATA